MSKLIDLTGQRFDRWTVLERVENYKNGATRWLCRCDCGMTRIVRAQALRSSTSKSCGCLRKERAAISFTVDGRSKERLYKTWLGIKTRCSNPNEPNFSNYGGRGIKVCEEWEKDYLLFRAWALENGYQEDLTIDRIDNNGPYAPENCRWADKQTQGRNKRNNHQITFNGETLPLSEWAERMGLEKAALWSRINKGWPIERALTEPVHTGKGKKK